MKVACGLVLSLLLSISTIEAQSMEGVEVLEVSSSKKSVLLNIGYAEGLRNGDRAKIYLKDLEEGLESPEFIYVGEGEAIKVKNNISYWFLRKIKNFRYLRKNKNLVMVRQSKDPRRPFVTRRTLNVQGRLQGQEYYQVSEDSGVPDDLIFEDDDFFVGNQVKDTKPTKKQNIEVTRKDRYIQVGDEFDDEFDQSRVRLATPFDGGDEQLLKEIEKGAQDRVFDSTSRKSVEKYNELKYGLGGLYRDQVRGPENITDQTGFDSMREKSALMKKANRRISPAAIARIRKEGPRWSQDMTDEQLRTYLVQTGIAGEIQRQKRALSEKEGHEFTLRYTTNLTQNTTTEDPNYQSTDYALSFSYEWHLGSTSEYFKNFTAEFEIERGISHYDIGGINGRISEGSLKGYLNWYFLRPPSSLHSYMPYLGLGLKRGNGELESAEFENIYAVQLMAFPSAHFGLKYRFKSGDAKEDELNIGMAVNFQVKYESMRYNIVDNIVDNIEPTWSSNQTRFSVGLNVYF